MDTAILLPQATQILSSTLDDETGEKLQAVFARVPSPYDAPEKTLLALLPALGMLPQPLLERFKAFRNDPTAPGAWLLRHWPRDRELPATPQTGAHAEQKSTWVSEGALLTAAQLLGELFAYRAEKGGALVHQVLPVAGSELARSNEGSLVDLDMHTEAAFFLFRPHFILLVCLRGDAQGDARTTVASATALCRHLDPATLAVLRAPVFQLRAPQSFDQGLGEVRWSEPRPMITGPVDLPEICTNLNGVRAMTPHSEQALAAVRAVLQQPGVVQSVCLTPGDMLVVNNRKALHGRTPFTPRFDGQDRWLQRCYVRSDLWDGRTNPGAPIRVF